MKVYFSHRPYTGISIGASISESGELIIAGAFTNRGITPRGRLNPKRRDKFSRIRSREILTGRIKKALNYDVPFTHKFGVYTLPAGLTLGGFMRLWRDKFKPDPKDQAVDDIYLIGSIEDRWSKIILYAVNALEKIDDSKPMSAV